MTKFTIDDVLENIKTEFTNTKGKTSLEISDRTITETLTPLLSLVGEEIELTQFIKDYAKPIIDAANRNYIKGVSDKIKDLKKPKKNSSLDTEDVLHNNAIQALEEEQNNGIKAISESFNTEEFINKIIEAQQNAINKAIEPLQTKIISLEQEKFEELRLAQINDKKEALKLSKNWQVDFDNSVELACALLPKSASAEDIYKRAYEHFNKTLAARGETYKPVESSGGASTTDFSDIIAYNEKQKKKNEEMNV